MAEQGGEELTAEVAGQKFSYRGVHLGNILQVAIVGVGVWAGLTFMGAQKEMKDDHAALSKVLENQQRVLEKQLEAQVEFNYIITLKQERREQLNLQMPVSLRNKIRELQ